MWNGQPEGTVYKFMEKGRRQDGSKYGNKKAAVAAFQTSWIARSLLFVEGWPAATFLTTSYNSNSFPSAKPTCCQTISPFRSRQMCAAACSRSMPGRDPCWGRRNSHSSIHGHSRMAPRASWYADHPWKRRSVSHRFPFASRRTDHEWSSTPRCTAYTRLPRNR